MVLLDVNIAHVDVSNMLKVTMLLVYFSPCAPSLLSTFEPLLGNNCYGCKQCYKQNLAWQHCSINGSNNIGCHSKGLEGKLLDQLEFVLHFFKIPARNTTVLDKDFSRVVLVHPWRMMKLHVTALGLKHIIAHIHKPRHQNAA